MSDKRELSRADIARQRRAQRAAKEMQQTTQRALKPIAAVSSRIVPTRPVIKLKRVKIPRRFNASLGVPEIHLHRRAIAMPNLRESSRRSSFLIAVFLGAVIYFVLTLPYFHVQRATVLGNSRLSSEEVDAALGVYGQSIFTVRPKDLAASLRMNYPELASAVVKVYLPNHVYVTVTERQPVISWQQGDGYTWIDSTGVAFIPRGSGEELVSVSGMAAPPAGLAILDDPLSPPPFMQQELVKAILDLSPNVPAGSTMIFDSTYGLGWNDPRGWQAFFGMSAKDTPLKIRVYQSLVDSLVSRGRIPAFINVAYPDAPFYRMTNVEVQEVTVEDGQ
jgi:hypothetical protein